MENKGDESKYSDDEKSGDEGSDIAEKLNSMKFRDEDAESKSSGGSPSRSKGSKDTYNNESSQTRGSQSKDLQSDGHSDGEEIAKGLKLLEMSMRDTNSGTMVWRSTAFSDNDKDTDKDTDKSGDKGGKSGVSRGSKGGQMSLSQCFIGEMSERVPTKILACKAISREILFSSRVSLRV